jgi:hypothetical protein
MSNSSLARDSVPLEPLNRDLSAPWSPHRAHGVRSRISDPFLHAVPDKGQRKGSYDRIPNKPTTAAGKISFSVLALALSWSIDCQAGFAYALQAANFRFCPFWEIA